DRATCLYNIVRNLRAGVISPTTQAIASRRPSPTTKFVSWSRVLIAVTNDAEPIARPQSVNLLARITRLSGLVRGHVDAETRWLPLSSPSLAPSPPRPPLLETEVT